jgi:hypothetical protein
MITHLKSSTGKQLMKRHRSLYDTVKQRKVLHSIMEKIMQINNNIHQEKQKHGDLELLWMDYELRTELPSSHSPDF